jgi:acetyltransferase
LTPAVDCRSAVESIAAARRIGFPVVLKLLSTRLTHKSDVGGVQLNLADELAVRDAFERIRHNVAKVGNADAFDGVTVQPMVTEKGIELIIGSSTDRQFGPVVLFGAGAVRVEVLQDRALGLPPLNRTLARRLMERTRIFPALQGVRGQKPVDMEALETMLTRFSLLLTDFAGDIQEVDMNPVLAAPGRVLALDARVLLSAPDRPEGEKPRLAIRPYPNQYTAPFRLRDGTEVVVRAIGPEDEPLIVDLHAHHSEHTIRMRFFSLVKTHSRDSLIRLCHLDYDREMALAAVRRDGGEVHMAGVSRYYLDPETGEAEFAVVVGDAHQHQGLGRHLMQRLIDVARERGVRRLAGLVLRENTPMLALMASLGFSAPETVENDVVRVVLDLDNSP